MAKTKQNIEKKPLKRQSTLLQLGFQRSSNSADQSFNQFATLENECEFCGRSFHHQGAKKSHQMHCKDNPERITAAGKEQNSPSEKLNPQSTNTLISPIFDGIIEAVCKSSSNPGGWRLADIFNSKKRVYKVFEQR